MAKKKTLGVRFCFVAGLIVLILACRPNASKQSTPLVSRLVEHLNSIGAAYELDDEGNIGRISFDSVSCEELAFLADSEATKGITFLAFYKTEFADSFKLPDLPKPFNLRLESCVVPSDSLLEDARGLQSLSLIEVDANNGIIPERGLPNLKGIGIVNSSIASGDLDGLMQSVRLERFVLVAREKFDESEVNFLASLPQLKALNFSNEKFEGLIFENFSSASKLEELTLNWTGLNDHACQFLSDFGNLRVLRLEGCPITDAGLLHFESLQKLEELNLRNTDVTDASIQTLEKMKGLRRAYSENETIRAWLVENGLNK